MKKLILGFLFFGILISCHEKGVETIKNGNFTNELLFEQDGCKMYRFMDGGRAIYWSNCNGHIEYTERHSSGKSTTSEIVESITLNNKK